MKGRRAGLPHKMQKTQLNLNFREATSLFFFFFCIYVPNIAQAILIPKRIIRCSSEIQV